MIDVMRRQRSPQPRTLIEAKDGYGRSWKTYICVLILRTGMQLGPNLPESVANIHY